MIVDKECQEAGDTADRARTTGLLLAAGGGRRAGGAKALRRFADGSSWLTQSVRTLVSGGCRSVIVVLGSQADAARELLPSGGRPAAQVRVVEAPDWGDGVAASLRAGLETVQTMSTPAVLIHLVDLPDVDDRIVRRVLERVPSGARVRARAVYRGRPGHPVMLGHAHFQPLLDELTGDTGAQHYLRRHGVQEVECGDLASGLDVDSPP